MRRIHGTHQGTLSELNITPLLDLVFVLLVIFIITTPQLTRHLALALPSDPLPPGSRPQPEPVVILVDAQGRVFLEGAPLEEAALRERIRSLHLAAPDRGFVVRGAADVEYQRVIDVFGLLDELQIANLGLDPEPGTAGP